jgi:DnaJ-class molecular chaperone
MSAATPCLECGGDGYHLLEMGWPEEYAVSCPRCHATGEEPEPEPCRLCASGEVWHCPVCDGRA